MFLKPSRTVQSDGSLANVCDAALSADIRVICNDQHPLRDPPTMLVRLAEPPSVVGIGGGQTTDARLGVVAVVIAAWEEVFGISPGNSEGT